MTGRPSLLHMKEVGLGKAAGSWRRSIGTLLAFSSIFSKTLSRKFGAPKRVNVQIVNS